MNHGLFPEAENRAQRMFFILAAALVVSLAGMLIVWALHTPFAISGMKSHLKRPLVYVAKSPISHC